MKIVSVAQMRALEAAAFASGTSEAELQQRAGVAVAEEIAPLVGAGQRVCVLVGHGNNGRDGFVAGRWLAQRGYQVDLVLTPRHALVRDELRELERLGVSVVPSDEPAEPLARASVVLDALVGIGARGELREPFARLATLANQTRATVVALDLPSGVDADTGAVAGSAVRADVTVTLGAIKQGLLRFPAAAHVGRLVARDIGLAATDGLPYTAIMPDEVALSPRPLDAHKYRFGRLLVLAGSDHFPGAAVLCAGAAARAGAGLVTVGATPAVRAAIAARVPEVTYTQTDIDVRHGPAAALAPYLASHTTVLVGPGLGRGEQQTAFVGDVLRARSSTSSLVVDADGLFALSEIKDWWSALGTNAVLTPHAGELARLVGHEHDAAAEAPWVSAGVLAQRWGCVLVAKGPFTSVAAPDGRVEVWPAANPALATGGTGDVLAGLLAGLLAQGWPPFDGARLAVAVHALAAQRLSGGRGWRTLLASDLLTEIPAVLGGLTQR